MPNKSDQPDYFWTQQLSGGLRRALYKEIKLETITAGTALLREGAPHDDHAFALCGLMSGTLNFEIASKDQGAFTVHIMHPGTWIGAAQNINPSESWQTIRAATDCEIHTLSRPAFASLVIKYPEIWLGVAAIIAQNLGTMSGRVEALMVRDSTARMLAVIRQISGYTENPNPEVEYFVAMTQDELAIAANLSVRATRTILQGLERSGKIRSGYGTIILMPENIGGITL